MSTVQIEKAYFETLLRRAECHGPISDSVVVNKVEYSNLLQSKQEYDALRQALYRGGATPEALDLLVNGPLDTPELDSSNLNWAEDGTFIQKPKSRPVRITVEQDGATGRPRLDRSVSVDNRSRAFGSGHHGLQSGQYGRSPDSGDPAMADAFEDDVDEYFPNQSGRKLKGGKGEHTLWLTNLPNGVTHKDVTSVVRGGRLVDVWLHRKDRAAAVTFAEGAAEFLAYAKRNDLYIGSKRVEVAWADRQFSFPSHLVNKLQNGASRNLVIRNAVGKLTDARIRADMEHIHNLIIIAIVWQGPDAYISTNSVNNAMFAKTCMMSRALYKGLRVDWYPDECADALPKRPAPPKRDNSTTAVKPSAPTNRFDLLNIDGSEGGSEQVSDDDTSRISGINLAPRSMDTSTIVTNA